jgi:hypothetical protein
MAFNPDRFVIINGIQYSRERAQRDGLLDDKGKPKQDAAGAPVPAGPSSTRARSASSTRRKDATAAEGDADQGA